MTQKAQELSDLLAAQSHKPRIVIRAILSNSIDWTARPVHRLITSRGRGNQPYFACGASRDLPGLVTAMVINTGFHASTGFDPDSLALQMNRLVHDLSQN
jgi:hypothetical protein